MSCLHPTPPAANLWDLDQITDDALGVLRLREGDVDEDRVRDLATAATGRVDDHVDRVEPAPPTPAMITAAVTLTVDLYLTGATSAEAAGVTADDRIVRDMAIAIPAKQRWGLA